MNQTLGQYLKQVRKERKLTLRAVEKETNISNAYLSQLENSKIVKPSPSVLHKLAACYGASYNYLMKLAGYPLPSATIKREKMKPVFRSKGGYDDLTDEEREKVREYVEFLRSRRHKR